MVIVKKIALILLKRCNKKNVQLSTYVNPVSQNEITNLGFAFLSVAFNYKKNFFFEFVCII